MPIPTSSRSATTPSGSCCSSTTTTTVRGRRRRSPKRSTGGADAVSSILSRLKERGLVRHKRPYWAITDDEERLREAYRLHRQQETADERYGEERLEDLKPDGAQEVR